MALFILLFSFNLEAQYRFDFEIDSSGGSSNCQLDQWVQFPENRWCNDSLAPLAGDFSLHHCYDNPEAGCDYLVMRHDPLSLSDTFSLDFQIRHAYPPSSQNSWQLALLAEFQEDVIWKGIVVGVNFKGSDDLLKVWGVWYGVSEEYLVSSLNYEEQVGEEEAPRFRLQWDGQGKLELYGSVDPGSQELLLLGSCNPSRLPFGRELVLRYRYSSSRDRALWMDELELEGSFERDTLPPEVREVQVEGASHIRIVFTEPVLLPETTSFGLLSEDVPEAMVPDSLWESEAGLMLAFSDPIPNRLALRLRVEGIGDPEGNTMRDTVLLLMRNEAIWGDLVFNELMCDPDPPIRLNAEYLELFNRSSYPLNMEHWLLNVNERDYFIGDYLYSSVLLDSSLIIAPGAFVLLDGITLPNEGGILSLYSAEGELIHAAAYKPPWDGANWKKEGGWSLESPDANQLCTVSKNWEFSSDLSGGTPGRINSNVRELFDVEAPVLLFAGLGNPGEFLLHFSETVRISEGVKAGFRLDPGGSGAEWVEALDPLSEILSLRFSEDFQTLQSYRLSLPGLSDCTGNISGKVEVQAGVLSKANYASVVINEIMYDPEEGKPEYVELYLPGEKIYDLQDLSIHFVEEGGIANNPVALSTCSRLILPGQYLVLTGCVAHLEDSYGLEVSGQWVEVEDLSGLNNSSGSVYLSDRAGNVVDRVDYRDDMHLELLDDPKGISLERIAWDRAGTDPDNWHSAASIEGYATPGRKNSQSFADSDSEDLLTVEPEVFSPDMDGFEDLLEIVIRCGGQDWVLGVWITDMNGVLVRILANNHIAGPSVRYTWDGEGENGGMQPMGFYVVHVKAYHPASGELWIRRKALGLVYR